MYILNAKILAAFLSTSRRVAQENIVLSCGTNAAHSIAQAIGAISAEATASSRSGGDSGSPAPPPAWAVSAVAGPAPRLATLFDPGRFRLVAQRAVPLPVLHDLSLLEMAYIKGGAPELKHALVTVLASHGPSDASGDSDASGASGKDHDGKPVPFRRRARSAWALRPRPLGPSAPGDPTLAVARHAGLLAKSRPRPGRAPAVGGRRGLSGLGPHGGLRGGGGLVVVVMNVHLDAAGTNAHRAAQMAAAAEAVAAEASALVSSRDGAQQPPLTSSWSLVAAGVAAPAPATGRAAASEGGGAPGSRRPWPRRLGPAGPPQRHWAHGWAHGWSRGMSRGGGRRWGGAGRGWGGAGLGLRRPLLAWTTAGGSAVGAASSTVRRAGGGGGVAGCYTGGRVVAVVAGDTNCFHAHRPTQAADLADLMATLETCLEPCREADLEHRCFRSRQQGKGSGDGRGGGGSGAGGSWAVRDCHAAVHGGFEAEALRGGALDTHWFARSDEEGIGHRAAAALGGDFLRLHACCYRRSSSSSSSSSLSLSLSLSGSLLLDHEIKLGRCCLFWAHPLLPPSRPVQLMPLPNPLRPCRPAGIRPPQTVRRCGLQRGSARRRRDRRRQSLRPRSRLGRT